jgi:phosphoribosyl-AMP cyclohydrolase
MRGLDPRMLQAFQVRESVAWIAGSSPAMMFIGMRIALPGNLDLEETLAFAPKFDADGLVTCVATDAKSGDVLMVAHMNAEALQKTIATGEAWYFSRSRKRLWRKGETSGHNQRVVEMRVDCDQDAVWIKVEQQGGACHTGRRSCFYRAVPVGKSGAVTLQFREADKVFDPDKAYKK